MGKIVISMGAFLSLCLLILFLGSQGYAEEKAAYRFTFDDIKLLNYQSHASIKAEISV